MKNVEKRNDYLLNSLYFKYSFENIEQIEDIGIAETGYKTLDEIPFDANFKPYDNSNGWGGKADSHYWFVFEVYVPENYSEYVLSVKTGYGVWHSSNPQFIVYIDGEIIQGLDENHTEIKFSKAGRQTVWLYAYVGSQTNDKLKLSVEKFKVRRDVRKLYYWLYVLNDIVNVSNPSSREYIVNAEHIDKTLSFIDFSLPRLSEQSVELALKYLEENAVNHNDAQETVYCVGQTHIDVEWLWTLAQTKEKVQRSFTNVIALMKEYKNSTFISSTPLLYEYIKETQPKVYSEIKKMIKEGRWEVNGGTWVESDTVLSGGESLVRQFLYGKRYFKKNFNVDSKILWLPDCFGYSAALPQIAKDCGIDWFVTCKISWNEINQFPHDIFEWQGIDGSKLKTYFLTTVAKEKHGYTPYTAYNGMATARQMIGTCDRLTDKNLSDIVLSAYGWGDGGGGPTTYMHEQKNFMQKGVVGLPKIKDATVSEFFRDLDLKMKDKTLQKWKGELYFEYHRGTYTSIAKVKRANRKVENLLSNAEFLCAVNGDYSKKETIESAWKTVLTHQFHDALPGSSIKEVYDEMENDYAKISDVLNSVIAEQVDKIVEKDNLCGDAVVFNFNSHPASGEIYLDGKKIFVSDVPAKGYKTINIKDETSKGAVVAENNVIENEFIKVTFNENYQIISLFDKKISREVVSDGGKFNILNTYLDVNDTYDAWELHENHLNRSESVDDVESVKYFNDGLRAGVSVVRKFRSSTISETISLSAYASDIDVETTVDWHEKNVLLKAEFQADIMSDKATYNIQFGNIERSTLNNTSYDVAQFEVPFHKFFDLSEGDYGVAIINDCKYGGIVKENKMSLTLIKSASYPYKEADEGKHEFKYSIVPHQGNYAQGGIVKKAYNFNNPLFVAPLSGGDRLESKSFITVDAENVVVETVKLAEEGQAVIVRLYDAFNVKTNCKIKLSQKARKITECDMLENEKCVLAENTDDFEIRVENYQIKTLRIEL